VSRLPIPGIVTVYGAEWCGDCRRAKRVLEASGVPFRYVDLEADPAAQRLVDDAGYRSIPVIVTPAGEVLVEPSDDELATVTGSAARARPAAARGALRTGRLDAGATLPAPRVVARPGRTRCP
jgi:mycoredoxin